MKNSRGTEENNIVNCDSAFSKLIFTPKLDFNFFPLQKNKTATESRNKKHFMNIVVSTLKNKLKLNNSKGININSCNHVIRSNPFFEKAEPAPNNNPIIKLINAEKNPTIKA